MKNNVIPFIIASNPQKTYKHIAMQLDKLIIQYPFEEPSFVKYYK